MECFWLYARLCCVIVLIKYFTFPFLSWFSEENAVSKIQLQLLRPNVAVDQYGNKGHWTLIYNQGFEITVNQRVYFAFSSYAQVYWLCWCCQCIWCSYVLFLFFLRMDLKLLVTVIKLWLDGPMIQWLIIGPASKAKTLYNDHQKFTLRSGKTW